MTRTGQSGSLIAWTLIGMAGSILLIEGWGDAFVATLCFAIIVLWAYPVRPRALLSRLVPFFIFAAIAFAFGALGDGATEASQEALPAGGEAVSRAAMAAIRLMLVGVAATWIGLYVGAARMIALLAAFGRATRRVGVDLTVPLLALGVAIRFLPLVQEEARRLQVAWEARGAGLALRGLSGRIRYVSAMTVPLLAAALRRAEALAEAIEVRLGGSSLHGAHLWDVGTDRQGGKEIRGVSFRSWIGAIAAWCVVVLRVWRWVG